MQFSGYTVNILNQTELERFWSNSFVVSDSHLASHQVEILGVATPGVWNLVVMGQSEYNVTVSAQTELKTNVLHDEKGTHPIDVRAGALKTLIEFSLNELLYTKPALLDFVHISRMDASFTYYVNSMYSNKSKNF